jgi:N-acetylglutamate synthase-like GNAT family acetyltransferase
LNKGGTTLIAAKPRLAAVELVQPTCNEELAAAVAALTRFAYATGDPYPGLPVADGARETAEQVLRDTGAGAELWLARVGDELVGTARVRVTMSRVAEVFRVAVAPQWRGRGVVRSLLDRIETDVARRGIGQIVANAVVERHLPALYARLGYRTLQWGPAPDKPLTEVTMARRPNTPRLPTPYPEQLPGRGLLVAWFRSAEGTLVACSRVCGDTLAAARRQGAAIASATGRTAELVGADLWEDSPPSPAQLLASLCQAPGRTLRQGLGLYVPAEPSCMLDYRIPRLRHAELHALWRLFPVPRQPTKTAHARS